MKNNSKNETHYEYHDGGMNVDQWICLSLTTGEKVAPGSSEYGGGWLTLLRGTGNGAATTLPHLTAASAFVALKKKD